MTDELAGLREKIAALDRAVLDALNQRLELVQQVRAHKQETGTRIIDAEREAELLNELVAANGGPLGEGAVRALFSAVLDVMKQESAAGAPARATGTAPAPAHRSRGSRSSARGSSAPRSRWRRGAQACRR